MIYAQRWLFAALATLLSAVPAFASAVTYVRPSISLILPTEREWDNTVGFGIALGNLPDPEKPPAYELELGVARFKGEVSESGVTLRGEQTVAPLLASYRHHSAGPGGRSYFAVPVGAAHVQSTATLRFQGNTVTDSDSAWSFAWALSAGYCLDLPRGGFLEFGYRFMRIETRRTTELFGIEIEQRGGGANIISLSFGVDW
jgi:opacity protein-like surface antigen